MKEQKGIPRVTAKRILWMTAERTQRGQPKLNWRSSEALEESSFGGQN